MAAPGDSIRGGEDAGEGSSFGTGTGDATNGKTKGAPATEPVVKSRTFKGETATPRAGEVF